jgi:ribosomal protein L37AE/L43A
MRAEADAALVAFASQGRSVHHVPAVKLQEFACASCGKVSVLGISAGRPIVCPQCRAVGASLAS